MKVGHVIVPAADIEAQVAFYAALGLSVRFRDGDRYVAMTDGTVTLGLADASQQPVPGAVLVSVQVDDLDAFIAGLPTAGRQLPQPVVGPHERRIVVDDPSGNPVVVYERRA